MRERLNAEEEIDRGDDIMEDREAQKQLIHPYRKYQLWIFVMIIIGIILAIMTVNENKQLNKLLGEEQNLIYQIEDLQAESNQIQEFYERVEVNYKDLFGLDKQKNIDVIHEYEELDRLSSSISKKGTVSYTICYKATIDGDSYEKFKELCEGVSPILFLIETVDGYRFAVYTSVPFTKKNKGYLYDDEAFIFSFDTMKKYKIEQPEYAVLDNKDSFPTFGRNDIVLGKNILSGSNSYALYPVSFERDPNAPGDYILNGGMKKFAVKELEVLSPFIFKSDE